jgi:hypothetical protein
MSKYCPNKNTEDFKKMSAVLGDKIATTVWYENQGYPIWKDNQGNTSPLWEELMTYPGISNENTAMEIKSRMFTKSFKAHRTDMGLDQSREPSVSQLLDHINNHEARQASLKLLGEYGLLNKDGKAKKWLATTANYKKVVAIAAKLNKTGEVVATINKIPVGSKTYYSIILKPSTAFTTEDGEKVAYYDAKSGEITFTDKGLTAETVVHEFAHPFVDALAKHNKELFDNLISQIEQDYNVDTIKKVVDHVNTHYKDASQEVRDKELLAYTISEYGKGNIDIETGKNTKAAIRRFYAWVKDLAKGLRDLLRMQGMVYVDQITPNTKYTELADFFTVYGERGVINLGPKPSEAKISPEEIKTNVENKADKKKKFKDDILNRKKSKGGKEDLPPAYKAIVPKPASFVELKDEAEHMDSLLPSEIATRLTPGYVKVLSGGKAVVGMFKDGIIHLSAKGPKGTAYHEGFHAVFRSLLSTSEQRALYKEVAQEEVKPTTKQIFDLQLEHGISIDEAIDLFREEQLADMFQEYMENPDKYSYPSGIKGFFQQLMDWITGVFSSKKTIRQVFDNISTGKYKKRTPNITRGVAYKTHPVFDIGQVKRITHELASVMFQNIKTVDDLNTSDLKMSDVTDRFKDILAESEDISEDLYDNIVELLDENGDLDIFWLKEVDSYLRSNLGLRDKNRKTITETDEDTDNVEDAERNFLTKSSYEISGKVKASTAVKFMIAMTPAVDPKTGQTQLSELTGLPVLVDFASTYNDIENMMADVVSVNTENGMSDAFEEMMARLKEHQKYKPHLFALAERLEASDQVIKTQFFNAFSRQKGEYVTHTVTGKPGKGVESRFQGSNFNTKDTTIFQTWASNFATAFSTVRDGENVYNPHAISKFVEDFNKLKITMENEMRAVYYENKPISAAPFMQIQGLFEQLGVNISMEAINYIVEENLSGATENMAEAFAEEFYTLVQQFEHAMFNPAGNNIPLNERTGAIVFENNHLENNKTFFKQTLAKAEAYFKKIPGEQSYVGPDGNQIYSFQDNDLTSKVIAQMKQGDLTHIQRVKDSLFGQHSLWAEELLNDASARELFHTEMYGNFRNFDRAGDRGSKAAGLKPVDAYMDNFNKHMAGYYIGLAEADKTRQTYFKGPQFQSMGIKEVEVEGNKKLVWAHDNGAKIVKGYLADELARMRVAHGVVFDRDSANATPEEDWVLYYHYYPVEPGTGTIGEKKDKIPGNAFQSFLFPGIPLGKMGLLEEDGRVVELGNANFFANELVDKFIKSQLYKLVQKEVETAVNMKLLTRWKDGSLHNRLISTKVIHNDARGYRTLVPKKGGKKGEKDVVVDYTAIVGDYVLNSLIGSVESTKLFNGDPAAYKVKDVHLLGTEDVKGKYGPKGELITWQKLGIFDDFKKRVPAAYAAGKDFRIFSVNGATVVPPSYTSQTVANISTPSAFFGTTNDKGETVFNEDAIKDISKATGVTQKDLKELFEPYLTINQTDAQAWITLDAYKERMNGLGKWTDAHEDAYQKANSGKPIENIKDLKLLAQPLKTVHAELVETQNNELLMHYNKQSEAVLFPFMKGLEIGNLLTAMENSGVKHAIVLDGKKVGASGIVDIMEGNNIKSPNDIDFENTKVELSYNNLFLQQDLPTKGIKDDTLVGSQGTKNVLAAVELDEKYMDDMTGREVIDKFNATIGRLSDLGLISLDKELGYDDAKKSYGGKTDKLRKTLKKEFETEVSENHLSALDEDIVFDALPIKNKIMNKLLAMVTNKTVRLKQPGGALVQLSDLGFIGKEVKVTDKVKNGIIWFKDPSEKLKPMHMEKGEVKPAQVLIPHTKLLEMLDNDRNFALMEKMHLEFGVTEFKELTSEQLMKLIDKETLEGFSYRIPNQGLSSNDAFEIVGVLPKEMGDTMIAYSDITTKTGSDFDIDKAFVILPNFYYDQKEGKIKKIGYDLNNLNSNREKGLQNLRLDLMRSMITHPKAFASVMAPLDDPWLESLAKELFPEKTDLLPLEFFTGSHQLGIKNVFDNAKSLVGSIANHMTHHSLSLSEDLAFKHYYLGIGQKNKENETSLSNKYDIDGHEISFTLGGYMNAIVDAAKDPFISRANLNHYTAGTAFMLARAGAPRDWIVSFIGQPIIQQIVSAQARQEGEYGKKEYDGKNKRYMTPVEYVLSVYGKPGVRENTFRYREDFSGLPTNKEGDIKATAKQLANVIKSSEIDVESGTFDLTTIPENKRADFANFQLQVLRQFLEWQTKASQLNEVIKVTKADVDGATKTLTTGQLAVNLAQKVLQTTSIRNVDNLLGMRLNDTTGEFEIAEGDESKMIGRYFKNSVLAAMDRFKKFFIAGSPASNSVVENIAGSAGYTELITSDTIEKLAMDISNEVYAYAASQSDAFNIEPERLHEILYGTGEVKYGDTDLPSLATRVERAKNTFENNIFLQSLQFRAGREGAPTNVVLPSNETVKDAKDELFIAWSELFDPKTGDPQLAEDLVIYAFYSSGFSRSVGDFSEHIPNEWLKNVGFHEDMKRMNAEYSDPSALNHAEDMIYKNLYRNNKLVPTVNDTSAKQMTWKEGEGMVVPLKHGFILTENDSVDYAIGEGPFGTVFKRFVKRKIATAHDNAGNPTEFDYFLYKLAGYNTQGDAIYLRTNKLGISGYGNNIKEYTGDGKTSIFAQNNVSLPQELQTLVDELEQKGGITSEEYKQTKLYDMMSEDSLPTSEDKLQFCILSKK